jgi:hypothetical protein
LPVKWSLGQKGVNSETDPNGSVFVLSNVNFTGGRKSMKIAFFFVLGIAVGLLITVCVMLGSSRSNAQEESGDLASLLPDIGNIYRVSLAAPFQQVEGEIHDPDIANFYHNLMEKTGLNQID